MQSYINACPYLYIQYLFSWYKIFVIYIFYYFIAAFSIFAFAEYFVAAANMGYYWTLVNDLPDEEIVVKKPHPNNSLVGNNVYNPPKDLFPNNQEIPQAENIIPRNGHPVITAPDIAVKKEL